MSETGYMRAVLNTSPAYLLTLSMLAACTQVHMGETDAGPGRDGARLDAPPDSGPPDSGPGDASADAGPSEPRVYAFCVELTELRCRGNATCCGDLAARVGFLDGFTGCEAAQVEEQCRQMASETGLHDGSLRWDEGAAGAMIDDLETALRTCGAIPRRFDLSAAFEGTLGPGEDCTPDLPYNRSVGRFRCQPGLRCAFEGDEVSYRGVCAPIGTEGDSCNGNADCQPDLWCDGRLGTGEDGFIGRCAREGGTSDCSRDSHCRTRFCRWNIPPFLCVEPTAAQTWCGYVGA